ncbi:MULTISPECIES: hypothetical protein [unclassified Agrobacterium]|nr:MULTISPECIES: hypothetical protein [unclassified Agrobacterium]
MLENNDAWNRHSGKSPPEAMRAGAGSVTQSLRTIADAVSGHRPPSGDLRPAATWPFLRVIIV